METSECGLHAGQICISMAYNALIWDEDIKLKIFLKYVDNLKPPYFKPAKKSSDQTVSERRY